MHGKCSCGQVQFELTADPIFVHCCHCRMCQRQTGTAFALNALIEADQVVKHSGDIETIEMPSEKSHGQKISYCPTCRVALWSVYPGGGPKFLYVRVGALNNPDAYPPDIHIFTASKQSWVQPAPGTPVVEQFYDRNEMWPAGSLARHKAALEDG